MQNQLAFALAATTMCAPAQHNHDHDHPDVAGRERGLQAFELQDYVQARHAFLLSAWHADKGSQAMLAEMYWRGLGVARDGTIAYVWADLAAERGYPQLVAKRERYWNALDADERHRALQIGARYHEEYGDATARPRLDILLRSGRVRVSVAA